MLEREKQTADLIQRVLHLPKPFQNVTLAAKGLGDSQASIRTPNDHLSSKDFVPSYHIKAREDGWGIIAPTCLQNL